MSKDTANVDIVVHGLSFLFLIHIRCIGSPPENCDDLRTSAPSIRPCHWLRLHSPPRLKAQADPPSNPTIVIHIHVGTLHQASTHRHSDGPINQSISFSETRALMMILHEEGGLQTAQDGLQLQKAARSRPCPATRSTSIFCHTLCQRRASFAPKPFRSKPKGNFLGDQDVDRIPCPAVGAQLDARSCS